MNDRPTRPEDIRLSEILNAPVAEKPLSDEGCERLIADIRKLHDDEQMERLAEASRQSKIQRQRILVQLWQSGALQGVRSKSLAIDAKVTSAIGVRPWLVVAIAATLFFIGAVRSLVGEGQDCSPFDGVSASAGCAQSSPNDGQDAQEIPH